MLRLFRTVPDSLALFSSGPPPNLDTGFSRGHEIPGGYAEVDDDGVCVGRGGDFVFFGLTQQEDQLVYSFLEGARQTLIRL
jgi:hypothetical protein